MTVTLKSPLVYGVSDLFYVNTVTAHMYLINTNILPYMYT